MQTICTSLQTDNHTNATSLNVYMPDALPDAQPTASRAALKARKVDEQRLLVERSAAGYS